LGTASSSTRWPPGDETLAAGIARQHTERTRAAYHRPPAGQPLSASRAPHQLVSP